MVSDKDIKQFAADGYIILPCENMNVIDNVKTFISEKIRARYKYSGTSEDILNQAHKLKSPFTDIDANELVLFLINELKAEYKVDEIMYQTSVNFIRNLLGSDIVSQKNPNIVFQYPGSQRYSELHTDTPGNSPFELVSWLPLVNCYGSKSFYLVNPEITYELLRKNSSNYYQDWNEFKDAALKAATHLTIAYGEVLFFWSGLLHGSLVNTTDESRFSLNTRFKNTYAPHGKKDPLSFYRVFSKSALTTLNIGSIK